MDHLKADSDRIKYSSVQKKIFELLRESVIINNDINPEDIDHIDLWQFGQHNGLPTPLLDWTDSPFIGLFFALNEENNSAAETNQDRCVWILDINLLRLLNDHVTEEIRPKLSQRIRCVTTLEEQIPKMEMVREINGRNKRIAYQQGFFTRHVFYKSFEVWACRIANELAHPMYDTPLLTKLVFSTSAKQRSRLLRTLDKMNINNRTLFPDIVGSVNHVKFVLEHKPTPTRLEFSATQEKTS